MAYFIGLISGTSMDAVDAALVSFENGHPQLIAHHSPEMPDPIRATLAELIRCPQVSLEQLGRLDHQVGELFAEAALTLIQQSGLKAGQISAIGSHGQTLFHAPQAPHPFTMQIGDPNLIAQRTGITTVADFRRRDMAAGGQGAPLVPAFHNAVFRSRDHNRGILNLGGIANITLLPADPGQPVLGFDTGPANCLMDSWIEHHRGRHYDKDGEWAATGRVIPELLDRLLENDYFAVKPPKSTGRELFNLNWLASHHPGTAPAEDIQATLAQLTIESIARAVEQFTPNVDELYACGGGARNSHILQGLADRLPHIKIATTDVLSVPPNWVEAMAFAWLARQTLNGQPGNLPTVTGARSPVILGAIYPA